MVTLADGTVLPSEITVWAAGVAAAHHGIPGAAEHSLGLYTRRDAIALSDRIMATLDRISRTGQPGDVAVTVIGGGPTGVELAGTLADLRNITLAAHFPEIHPARVHITLIDRAPAPLAPFHPALRDYARRQPADRGVEVRLGTATAEITPGKVVLADGTVLPSDIKVWAAGVAAPEAVRGWACRRRPAAASAPAPTYALPGRTGSSRSATSRSPTASRCRSWPSRPADGQTRCRPDPAAGSRAAGGPVPLPRQGHHGHHRLPLRGYPAPAPGPRPRHGRLARLACPALITLLGRTPSTACRWRPAAAAPGRSWRASPSTNSSAFAHVRR